MSRATEGDDNGLWATWLTADRLPTDHELGYPDTRDVGRIEWVRLDNGKVSFYQSGDEYSDDEWIQCDDHLVIDFEALRRDHPL